MNDPQAIGLNTVIEQLQGQQTHITADVTQCDALEGAEPLKIEGCHFDGKFTIDLKGKQRLGFRPLEIRDCIFVGEVYLNRLDTPHVTFTKCKFLGGLHLYELAKSNVSLVACTTDKETWIWNAGLRQLRLSGCQMAGGFYCQKSTIHEQIEIGPDCSFDQAFVLGNRNENTTEWARHSQFAQGAMLVISRSRFSRGLDLSEVCGTDGSTGAILKFNEVELNGELDLRGTRLTSLDVKDCRLGQIKGTRGRGSGKPHFEVAGNSQLRGTRITGRVDLSDARFKGDLACAWVVFEQDADFSDAEFTAVGRFGEPEKSRLARATVFAEGARFEGTRFHQADFSQCRFDGVASWEGATFGPLDDREVREHEFHDLKCAGEVSFAGARYGAPLVFRPTLKKGRRGTVFHGAVDMTGLRPADKRIGLDLTNVEIKAGLNLSFKDVDGRAQLQSARLTNPRFGGDMDRLDLTSAQIEATPSHTVLDDFSCRYLLLQEAVLHGGVWAFAARHPDATWIKAWGVQMSGAEWSGTPSQPYVSLWGAHLRDCSFNALRMSSDQASERRTLQLGQAQVYETQFNKCVLDQVNLVGSYLEHCRFDACEIKELTIRGGLPGKRFGVDAPTELLSEDALDRVREQLKRNAVEGIAPPLLVRIDTTDDAAVKECDAVYQLVHKAGPGDDDPSTGKHVIPCTGGDPSELLRRALIESNRSLEARGLELASCTIKSCDQHPTPNAPPTFRGLRVNACTLAGPLFTECAFEDELAVEGSDITSPGLFSKCTFQGSVRIASTAFKACAEFKCARFEKDCTVDDVRFEQGLSFAGALFGGDLLLRSVNAASGHLDLSRANVAGKVVVQALGGPLPTLLDELSTQQLVLPDNLLGETDGELLLPPAAGEDALSRAEHFARLQRASEDRGSRREQRELHRQVMAARADYSWSNARAEAQLVTHHWLAEVLVALWVRVHPTVSLLASAHGTRPGRLLLWYLVFVVAGVGLYPALEGNTTIGTGLRTSAAAALTPLAVLLGVQDLQPKMNAWGARTAFLLHTLILAVTLLRYLMLAAPAYGGRARLEAFANKRRRDLRREGRSKIEGLTVQKDRKGPLV